MKRENLRYIYFGQKHKDFDYKDFELIQKISKLAKKHLRQAVNSCNGYGVVKGQMYYGGQIDDYAKREYGYNVKSAYINNSDETIFDKEGEIIEDKIKALLGISPTEPQQRIEGLNYLDKGHKSGKYILGFQGDPRGSTVKLYYENDFVELI